MLRSFGPVAARLARCARPALVPVTSYASIRPASLTVRQFGISALRRQEDGKTFVHTADAELVAALRAEQKIEQESLEDEADESQRFYQFAERQGFSIIEKPGAEEVQLVRQQGGETVRVFFSISDVINSDSILDDADTEGQGEESASNEDAEVDEESDFEAPIRLNIVVEKPTGAMGIEAVVQDDLVLVESITPYASAELAVDESAEADYKRRQVYQGPPFSVLDPSVQSAVQEFLESRNIDGRLALFIAEYSSFRENQEYIKWLGALADVVESN